MAGELHESGLGVLNRGDLHVNGHIASASNYYCTKIISFDGEDIDLVATYPGLICTALEDISGINGIINYLSWDDADDATPQYLNFDLGSTPPKQPQIRKLIFADSTCTTVKAYFLRKG